MKAKDEYSLLDAKKDAEGSEAANVVRLPLEALYSSSYQEQINYDAAALNELAASIGMYGVLQPLLVAPGEAGRYMLIDGERRLRAAKLAELSEVPVLISNYTSREAEELILIKNLQREDLHFWEEAEGYEQLIAKFKLKQKEVAARVGKEQSTIANKLRLLKISPGLREQVRTAGLTERHARALLSLEQPIQQAEVLATVIERGYNVRRTEKYIAEYLANARKEKKRRNRLDTALRGHLQSIKQIAKDIKADGNIVTMEQAQSGDEVIVTLRIKNKKKEQKFSTRPLFK